MPKCETKDCDCLMADECLQMVKEELIRFGCLHDKSHEDSTPPRMYPDWIRCVINSERKKALAQKE